MELQLFNTLNNTKNTSRRRAAILKVVQEENTSTALIILYLKIRYNIDTDISLNILEEVQKNNLYSEIKLKTRDEKLYRSKSNELVDLEKPSLWLTHGNVSEKMKHIYAICKTEIYSKEHLASVRIVKKDQNLSII